MDSWFICKKMIRLIYDLGKKIHIVDMTKMGKARYMFEDKNLTSKELVDVLKRRKKVS